MRTLFWMALKYLRKLFSLKAQIGFKLNIFLSIFLFVVLFFTYWHASNIRHEANPQDKILPTFGQMIDAVETMGFTVDKRTEKYLLWNDTAKSLTRLGIGLGASICVGLILGLTMGLFPFFRFLTLAFITFISVVPPLSILPILFIAFGVDEFAKIFLIFLGTAPFITRDIYLSVRNFPTEQIIKAQTLGASEFGVATRVVLPQIIPRLIDSTRLQLGAAFLFLIASEAIAAEAGLGYRIFLVRRYLSMDVIIPYVLWITLIGISLDGLCRGIIRLKYHWYLPKR